MVEISLCMIVKNEEKVIARCLESVKSIVDEIIIVDTGSTDNTKNIAKNYTEKIYDFEWIDDFSAARNFSFSKASKEFIMWLDADDVIEQKYLHEFKVLKNTLTDKIDVVKMKYNTSFDENNNPTFSYIRERLFRKNKNFKWVNAVHEIIIPSGNIITSDIAISHKKLYVNDPERNLRIFEKQINSNHALDARGKFYYARELYYNNRLDDAIEYFNLFLQDKTAWVENKIEACKYLSYCHKNKNNINYALKSLFESFTYDKPRGEICCEIGSIFMSLNRYEDAIFWYDISSKLTPNINSGAFIVKDCYDIIPYLQLCVCYYKLGDIKNAIRYHKKSKKIKPYNKSVIHNTNFFNSLNLD